VHLCLVRSSDEAQSAAAERLYEELTAAGVETLYDEREISPGIKFKDADLLGCPVHVIVGKHVADGRAEIKVRASGERATVHVEVREASTCFDAARGKPRPKSRGSIARDSGLPRGANAITRELKDLWLGEEDK